MQDTLTLKAVAEGGRSMLYECAKVADSMADCEAGRSRLDCSERTIDVLLVDDSRPNELIKH